jgi:hypothetical protein
LPLTPTYNERVKGRHAETGTAMEFPALPETDVTVVTAAADDIKGVVRRARPRLSANAYLLMK